MADNTTINNATSAGDVYRSKDRGAAKTSIVALDLDPAGGAESLMNGKMPTQDVTAQGTDSANATGPMVQAKVTDAAESYSADKVQPLSLNSEGRLRVVAAVEGQANPWLYFLSDPFEMDNPYNQEVSYV